MIDLRDIFKQASATLEGETAIVFRALEGVRDFDFEVNGDRVFPAASIIKLSILWAVMRRIEEGEAAFTDVLRVEDGDMFGTLEAQHHPIASTELTVRDLCMLMVDLSDNLASNMLVRCAGLDFINEEIRRCGLGQTVLRRKFLDYETRAKGVDNYTTPLETVRMITLFTDRAASGSALAADMLGILALQCDKNYLSQYMPDTFKFAHKTGHVPGALHNVGIVTTPAGGRYVVSVMTNRLQSDVEGLRFLNTFGERMFAFMREHEL